MSSNKLLTGALVVQLVILGTLVIAPAQTRTQPATASPQDPCPAGSYNIGTKDGINPICKLEPTGCPYGDSIPMDMCDKFKDQQEQPEPVKQPKPAQTSEAAQCGGK